MPSNTRHQTAEELRLWSVVALIVRAIARRLHLACRAVWQVLDGRLPERELAAGAAGLGR